jgi:hypothetical protein
MERFKVITEIIPAVVTSIPIIVGGVWVYWKFVLQQERYPNINLSADITLVGIQGYFKIIELIALIENKGKAQHKINSDNCFMLRHKIIYIYMDINIIN